MKSLCFHHQAGWIAVSTLIATLLFVSSASQSAEHPAESGKPSVTVPAKTATPVEPSLPEAAKIPVPPVPSATKAPPPPAQESANDPTVPGQELRNLMRPPKSEGSVAAPPAPPQVPTISLRGRVINASGEGLVVLSIGGQLVRFKAGNQFRVLLGTTPTTVQVDEITEEGVEVKITPQNESLSLR